MENLKTGDIVLNGYAAKDSNDLHIIVGTTTRTTGAYKQHSTTYYQCRMLFDGKLRKDLSLFNKKDNKLTKIGHFNFNEAIKNAVIEARAEWKGVK